MPEKSITRKKKWMEINTQRLVRGTQRTFQTENGRKKI